MGGVIRKIFRFFSSVRSERKEVCFVCVIRSRFRQTKNQGNFLSVRIIFFKY